MHMLLPSLEHSKDFSCEISLKRCPYGEAFSLIPDVFETHLHICRLGYNPGLLHGTEQAGRCRWQEICT